MVKRQTYTRRDVDGTVPGRAVLVCVNLSDGPTTAIFRPTHRVWIEGKEGVSDPLHAAEILRCNIPSVWGDQFAIIANPRAQYLRARNEVDNLPGFAWDMDDFVEMLNETSLREDA